MNRSAPASRFRDTGSFGTGPGSFVGKRVGPYTLCLELSSGGMATVFLARADAAAGHPRLVALKVIHRHLAESRDFVEMFVDEARISSQLRHRNVCEVYGLDTLDDTYYLAMEYLMGEPLSAVFRRTARRELDVRQHAALIVRVAADACAGLHAAHSLKDAHGTLLNVVHRDVSPENLFVTYSGVTKVVDFGLASARHQTHRTRTGIIKGKFAYVSPDALSGMRVDRRADVWSMGVVVWELLTGRRLFRGDSDMQTLAAVAEARIDPPSAVRPGLPPGLDAPLMRALSRDPAQRQRTAAQLASELLQACPAAERLDEHDVGEWMSSLFSNERRWKAQITELVQVFSRPGATDTPEDAPTRVWIAPVVPDRRRRRTRRRWPALALALLALLGVVTAAVPEPPAIESARARELPVAAAAPPEPIGTAELLAEALPDGNGYVLEIADPGQGKKTLLLRIRADQPQPAPPPESTEPEAPQPATTVAANAPPAWLRDVMERQRTHHPDLVDPY